MAGAAILIIAPTLLFFSCSPILPAAMEIIDWPMKSIGLLFAVFFQPGFQPFLA